MSGYIINPYSSDNTRSNNLSYSVESIPVLAYGLIGITSLTLAYMTFLDTAPSTAAAAQETTSSFTSALNSVSASATSLLPSSSPAMGPPQVAVPVSPQPLPVAQLIARPEDQRPAVGGEKRNKKTRRGPKKAGHHKKTRGNKKN